MFILSVNFKFQQFMSYHKNKIQIIENPVWTVLIFLISNQRSTASCCIMPSNISSRLLYCKTCKRLNRHSRLEQYSPHTSPHFLCVTCEVCNDVWFICAMHNRRWAKIIKLTNFPSPPRPVRRLMWHPPCPGQQQRASQSCQILNLQNSNRHSRSLTR